MMSCLSHNIPHVCVIYYCEEIHILNNLIIEYKDNPSGWANFISKLPVRIKRFKMRKKTLNGTD